MSFDPAAVIKRSRAVAGRMNNGVGFLMKKNKVPVIWGEAVIDAPGKITVKASKTEAPKGSLGARQLSGQAHHRRDRRAAARAARARAGQEAGVDLFRGDEPGQDAEVAAGDRLGRDRRRVRLVLPHAWAPR